MAISGLKDTAIVLARFSMTLIPCVQKLSHELVLTGW
jgi:hypothetical protein